MSTESSVSESKLVSNAILNKDIDTLKELADDNETEVFSTLVFDSYEDKRIEELLLLEGIRFLKETKYETYEYSIDISLRDLKPEMFENGDDTCHNRSNIKRYQVENPKQPLKTGCRGRYGSTNEFPCVYVSSMNRNLYLKLFHPNDSRIDKEAKDEVKFILSVQSYTNRCDSMYYEMVNKDFNFYRYYVMKYIQRLHSRYPLIPYDKNIESECIPIQVRISLMNDEYIEKSNIGIADIEHDDFVDLAHSFLLKRFCERHVLNESIVSSMKKKMEIERIYYKLSELVAEDVRLTKTVNSKKETLNSLIEDIGAKKRQLEQLDLKLINVHNELDAAASYFKQYQIANEIKYELSFEQLSFEEKHLLECKHLHEYYIQFANDLKVYKFTFEHMRELSSKLENERQEVEKMKANSNSELEAKMKAREQELEKKQAQFDAECEAYELESTKWKTQQESKFAKFQERIDNYESIKESRDALRKENDKLKAQLKSITTERDKYKTTIQTMMSFKK